MKHALYVISLEFGIELCSNSNTKNASWNIIRGPWLPGGGLLPRTAGGYNDPGHQGEEGLYDAEKKHVLVVGPLRGEGGGSKNDSTKVSE